MNFYEDFLGDENASLTKQFFGGDQQKPYYENLKTQPQDWIYRTLEIQYSNNKLGHRCKNIEDIELDNYILFTGCSHTQGVGVRLEDSYPHIVSKKLDCDYYNLALGATGIDVVEYNLLTWFGKIKKKPKCVVIQWPDHSRFLSAYPNYKSLIENGSWSQDEHVQKFLASSEITGFFHARKNISYRLLKEVIDVPIIDVHFTSLSPYDNNSMLWFRKVDLGRDLSHSGIKSHRGVADTLITHIESLKQR